MWIIFYSVSSQIETSIPRKHGLAIAGYESVWLLSYRKLLSLISRPLSPYFILAIWLRIFLWVFNQYMGVLSICFRLSWSMLILMLFAVLWLLVLVSQRFGVGLIIFPFKYKWHMFGVYRFTFFPPDWCLQICLRINFIITW